MAIYLGEKGNIEISRQGSEEPLYGLLTPGDVNVEAQRFSELLASGALITGDYVTIKRTQTTDEEKNLELVKDHDFPDWSGYINVDSIGGVRLYKNFGDSIEGKKNESVELVKPSENQEVTIESRESRFRCLGQIRNFQVSTTRETVDTTVLSNQFRQNLKNGLISGQGQLECFWEHRVGDCETANSTGELNAYLARLLVRVQQGAGFLGKFYLYEVCGEPAVWYEAQCIVTNVSVSVSPETIIESTIDFVTTGPIQLKTGYEPSILIQEDADFILQEDGDPAFIDSPEQL